MHYGSTPHGQEDTVIFWCGHCGEQEAPQLWPIIQAGVHTACPACHKHGYRRFVAFTAGVEDEAAQAVIRGAAE